MGAMAQQKEGPAKLTVKQERFCLEYLVDFNATQAAIRAGYSEDAARQSGTLLLSNTAIQARISEAVKSLNNDTSQTIRRVICELQLIAFGDMRDLAEWEGDTAIFKDSKTLGDKSRLVSEVHSKAGKDGNSLKIKTWDKMKALEMLARYYKLFQDEPQSTQVTIKITMENARDVIAGDSFGRDIELSNDDFSNIVPE